MKWYEDNHDRNPDSEQEQNGFSEENKAQTSSVTEDRVSEEREASAEKTAEAAPQDQTQQNDMFREEQRPRDGQPTGSYSYTRENIPENTYRPSPYQNRNDWEQQQSGQYRQGGAYGQNPGQYGSQNGQHYYGEQGNPNGRYTQGQNQYSYGQNPYNPVQDGSRISYTPEKKAPHSSKKGNGRKAAVAIACCVGLLLSTGFGFLGAVIANRVFPAQVPSGNPTAGSAENEGSMSGGTAVFYKSVENVTTSTTENGGDLTLAQVASMVSDSVVEITTEFTTVSGWFQYVSEGAGSGVILSEDGYVITNNHVICSDDGVTPADGINVRLTNGEEYPATLVGTDSDADIAILKIDAVGLTPAVCGNSEKLAVGEAVLAVGNPLGELGGTKTEGIISALDREINVGGTPMTLMQTSAAVNPGNSGGGLFNMRGELIGIVNAKSSGSGIEGLGFAIPINDALSVSEQLLEYGYVRGKVTLGITFYDVTSSSVARMLGVNHYGVYVVELESGYNDDVLKLRDRVISVNGQEVSTGSDIAAALANHEVGDVLKFQISRNGSLMEVDVTCYEKVPATVGEVEFEE